MMKKINILLALALVAFMGIMTSCGEDTVVGPSLEFFGGDFIDDDATVEPGATIQFSFLATAGDANLVSLSVTRDGQNYGDYPDEDIEKDNYKDTISMLMPSGEQDYTVIISVEDKDGETASKTFIITVEATSTGSAVSAVTPSGAIGAQGHLTLGSYMNLTTGQVYTSGQVAGTGNGTPVDIICYYNSGAFLASPTDAGLAANTSLVSNLDPKNATKIGTTSLTATDFDAITDTYDFSGLTITGTSASISAGTVFAFETEAGKKGLVKVITVPAASDGSATVSIIAED